MTTREILAEIDMRGLTVCVIRVLSPGHPLAWSCAIDPDGCNPSPHEDAVSFDAALFAAWQAHTARVAA